MVELLFDGRHSVFGWDVSAPNCVTKHQDGAPIRFQEQLRGAFVQKTVKRGRRGAKHLPFLFAEHLNNSCLSLKKN